MPVEERRAMVARRDKEKIRARDRARAKKRQVHMVANTKAWRKKHPERLKAHNAVARALKKGVIVKGACEREGDECRGPVHAHHDDYAKPLEVRWLCGRHHHEVHAELRASANIVDPTKEQ